MKYTINELAKQANVAKSTVSKALNGQKGVSEKKRKEILKLAGKLNFQPNASARALAQSKTGTIGFVLPHALNYNSSGGYWSESITAIAISARKKNYNLMIIVSGEEDSTKNLESILQRKNVDGLIIPAEQITEKAIPLLLSTDIPFVILGQTQLLQHYSVDVRNNAGAQLITTELLNRGYKKLGCISGPSTYLYNQQRVEGFTTVLKNANLPTDSIIYTPYDEDISRQNIAKFLINNPDIEALFLSAGTDFALTVIDTMILEGFNMNHVCIATFDDYKAFDYLPVAIIAAHQPIIEMAKQASLVLFQLIDGGKPPRLSLFDIDVILR